mmetsp:Transcript_11769/g.28230  ORF Transcript_11769/g.28230 Transcript_11769/m.28230 type:complete len:87 (-) Transcript_11769:335-595(-)
MAHDHHAEQAALIRRTDGIRIGCRTIQLDNICLLSDEAGCVESQRDTLLVWSLTSKADRFALKGNGSELERPILEHSFRSSPPFDP